MFKRSLVTAAIFAPLFSMAHAAPTVFFAEDTSTSQSVTGTNSEAKRNEFLSNLTGVGTQNFEGIALGSISPLALTFPGSSGSLSATLLGTSCVDNNSSDGCGGGNPGRWATSGSQFWETSSNGSFSLDFASTPISVFGFYGADIGDFENQLTIDLTDINDVLTSITVPHSTDIGNEDNSLLFWGFFDTANSYKTIGFRNEGNGGDVFAFDDMTIGDLEQICTVNCPTNNVPEPGTALLAGVAVLGLLAARRRKTA